jgi:hypothetical protein
MSQEDFKKRRREENRKLRAYLRGTPPKIQFGGIAVFSDGSRYKMNQSGWRLISRGVM